MLLTSRSFMTCSVPCRKVNVINVVANVILHARPHNQVGARRGRLVRDGMPVGNARWPARRVTRKQHMRPVILGDGDFAGKHKQKLIRVLVPVPNGRLGAGQQGLNRSAEMRQRTGVGVAQRVDRSPSLFGIAFGLYLVLANDHWEGS